MSPPPVGGAVDIDSPDPPGWLARRPPPALITEARMAGKFEGVDCYGIEGTHAIHPLILGQTVTGIAAY